MGEVSYDAVLEVDGHELLYYPLSNFTLDAAHAMNSSDRTIPSLSDAAHVGLICDASFPTSNITIWCRDRVVRLPRRA